jgi:hypothetical protein
MTLSTADALAAVRSVISDAAQALQAAHTTQAVKRKARKAVKDLESIAKTVALAAGPMPTRTTTSQLDRVLASARPTYQSDENALYGNSKRSYHALRGGAAARPFSTCTWRNRGSAAASGAFYVNRAFWKDPAESDSSSPQGCDAARTWSSRQPDDDSGAPGSISVRHIYRYRMPGSSSSEATERSREARSWLSSWQPADTAKPDDQGQYNNEYNREALDSSSDNDSKSGPVSKRQRRAADTLSRDGGAGSGTNERLHQLFTEVRTAGKASYSAVLAHLQSAEKGRLSGTSKGFQELLSKPAVWSEVQLSTQAVPHWRKFKAYKRRDGSVAVKEVCPFNSVFAGMCSALTRQPR